MSIHVMSRVWEHSPYGGSSLLLLLGLADFADDDGVCWPAIPKQATRIRMSHRQTFRLIQELEQHAEIYIHPGGKGAGNTHRYAVLTGLTSAQITRVLTQRFGLDSEGVAVVLARRAAAEEERRQKREARQNRHEHRQVEQEVSEARDDAPHEREVAGSKPVAKHAILSPSSSEHGKHAMVSALPEASEQHAILSPLNGNQSQDAILSPFIEQKHAISAQESMPSEANKHADSGTKHDSALACDPSNDPSSDPSSDPPPPPATLKVAVAEDLSNQPQMHGSTPMAVPEATVEAELRAMGVQSRKALRSLAGVDRGLVALWRRVLADETLYQALLAHGIDDPVAFAVEALRDGAPPPADETLRRWLQPVSERRVTAQQAGADIPDIDAIPPEEWAAMPAAERRALMKAQAQRVNHRAAR